MSEIFVKNKKFNEKFNQKLNRMKYLINNLLDEMNEYK